MNTKWQSARVGWDQPRYSVYRASDRGYEKSVWAHAVSDYTYQLGGKWKTLTGLYGLEKGCEGGSVIFAIKGDDKELFRSQLVKGNSVPRPLEVDVAGVRELHLIVEDGGDGNNSDHAIWFDPKLER